MSIHEVALLHSHEADRLESLRSYQILDTPPERAYDALADLAALVCQAPMAAVSLIDEDRQWAKAQHGFDLQEVSRELALCSHTVAAGAPLVIGDARLDPRFADHPMVVGAGGLRAYAGVPLIGRDGLPLGALCVIDIEPRSFTPRQLRALADLADRVVTELELRRSDALQGRPLSGHADPLSDPVRLRRALDDGELVAWFQPLVDLASGCPLGFEALLRWDHPERGMLPPAGFLPAIESSGLMLPVGRHVLHGALSLLAELRRDPALPDLLGMAVNVSSVQLAQPGLADAVAEELASQSVPPEHLSLELTETAALLDHAGALRELRALREMGVHLVVDDYGTGFSGLMRVLDLPITALKLDRGITSRLPYDPRAMAVARSTLSMADDLGLGVVAEGIETEQQRSALLGMGCVYGQGFLFQRPMAREDVASMLGRWKAAPARDRSLTSEEGSLAPWHSIQFHSGDHELVDAVVTFLRPSLDAHDAVLAIATADHWALIARGLAVSGVDVDALVASGRLVAVLPDVPATALVRELHTTHGHVRVYSEAAAELWSRGRAADALALEQEWSELGRELAVSLHCAYPQEVMERGMTVEQLEQVCGLHTSMGTP